MIKIKQIIIIIIIIIYYYLLLRVAMRINSKMNIPHKPLNHANGVRTLSFGIECLLHNNGGDITKLIGQLRFPLLPSHLKLSFIQNLPNKTNAISESSLGFTSKPGYCLFFLLFASPTRETYLFVYNFCLFFLLFAVPHESVFSAKG